MNFLKICLSVYVKSMLKQWKFIVGVYAAYFLFLVIQQVPWQHVPTLLAIIISVALVGTMIKFIIFSVVPTIRHSNA